MFLDWHWIIRLPRQKPNFLETIGAKSHWIYLDSMQIESLDSLWIFLLNLLRFNCTLNLLRWIFCKIESSHIATLKHIAIQSNHFVGLLTYPIIQTNWLRITPEAARVLLEYFKVLKGAAEKLLGESYGTRQFQGLIRLVEALAKIRNKPFETISEVSVSNFFKHHDQQQ
jgi:hypothetical protein